MTSERETKIWNLDTARNYYTEKYTHQGKALIENIYKVSYLLENDSSCTLGKRERRELELKRLINAFHNFKSVETRVTDAMSHTHLQEPKAFK